MRSVLVTGATGSVGSRVVRELQARSAPVRAFVRDPAKAARLLGESVELAVGDFSDSGSLRRALDGVDRVLLACSNQPRQVELETAVIDAAAAAGARRLVKLSSIGVRVGSPVAFWDWHGRIEQLLERSGVPAAILRSNFYMTSLLASAEQIRHEGRFFMPVEGARVAMIDPGDVAAVAATLLTTEDFAAGTRVLSGPEAITFARVAEELSAATGRRIEFVAVPDEAARRGMLAAGMPEWLVDPFIALAGQLRQGVGEPTTDTVRALTGREPRSFGQFARDHAAMFATPSSTSAPR